MTTSRDLHRTWRRWLAVAAFAAAAAPSAPSQAAANVLSARFGGYEDCLSYGEGAGRAAPAVPAVYEALVVAQAPVAPRNGPPIFKALEAPICTITPDGPQPLTPQPGQPAPAPHAAPLCFNDRFWGGCTNTGR